MIFSRLKGFEMICESYPQFILNLFIMQSLQIQEWYNICSCAISAISVVYGYSEMMALISHGRTDYPFSRTVYGMLAIVVDSFFRGFSLAYLMTFLKGYILLFPLIYYLIVLIIVLLITKCNLGNHWEKIFLNLLFFVASLVVQE